MEGWIKLHRKIQTNEMWLSEPFSRGQAWVDLLLLAQHKDGFFYKRGVKVAYKRGQVTMSILGLSKRWMWSRGKIKRFLKDLKNEHQIDHQVNNVTQVVTVINYDEYQINEQQTDTRRTPDGHIQERKEYKEEEISNDISCRENLDEQPHEKGKEFFHEVCEVINYLNLKTGKKLRPESKSSKHIRGRLRDGFLVEDLKLVVDLKVDEWLHDVKMKKYLKPDTLFNAEKFDKYQDEIDDSTVGSAHNANLKKGDLITLEHLEKFEDDDVIICDFKTYDPDSFEDTTGARYKVKAIKGRISNKRGEFKFIEVVN